MLTRSAARSMQLSEATRFDNVKCVKPASSGPKAGVRCPVVKPVGISASSSALQCSSHTGFTCNSPFSYYLEQMCTKTRCYRLDLEGQSNVAVTAHPTRYCNRQAKSGVTTVEGRIPGSSGHQGYIPRTQALSCSHSQKRRKSSTDSAPSPKVNSHVKYADSTANIFRGVTVTNDGTMIPQNPFVQKVSDEVNEGIHNNGASRQIAVINEAVKFVDCISDKGSANLADSSKILSLHIMGEYEDFLSLVHDGPRRLQPEKSLTDEAMLFLNRRRRIPHCVTPTNNDRQKTCFMSSGTSKKRKNSSEDWARHFERRRQCSSASKPLNSSTKQASIHQSEQKRVHRGTTSLNRDNNHLPSAALVTNTIDRGNENDRSTAIHRSTATKKRGRSTTSTSARHIKRRRVHRNLPQSS